MEVHPYFRLDEREALTIIEAVKSSARTWREVAIRNGISGGAIEIKTPAFSHFEN